MTNRDRLLGLAVVAMWGFNFIAIRLSLDHFPPFFCAALRFTVMAVPVMLFVRFPKVRMTWFLVYAIGFGVLQFAFLFLAMHLGMPTGLASLVLQTSAPFTVVLGVLFLRERMTPLQIVGIAVAVGGMVLIGVDRATHSGMGLAAAGPMLLTVLGGLGWAIGNIGSRLARPDDALRMTLWMSVVPPIPFLILSVIIDGPTAGIGSLTTLGTHSGMLALVGLAYTVLLGTVAGSSLWTHLISRYEASRVAPLSLLVPVVGITASWALLGEEPSVIEIVGAVIVIAGCAAGVLAAPRNRPRIRDRRAPGEPDLEVVTSRSAEGFGQRLPDPVHGGPSVRADQRHVREAVDQ